MKNRNLVVALFGIVFLGTTVGWGQPKPSETGSVHEHERGEDGHESEKGHAHGTGEEKPANVGSEKGLLDASEGAGIKLSLEALKTFEIRTQKLVGGGPWALPESARVHSGEEVNIFRLRQGFFKRIDFSQHQRSAGRIVVSSEDLRAGDEVVVSGVGFLRIAELTAFGGAPEGHSH